MDELETRPEPSIGGDPPAPAADPAPAPKPLKLPARIAGSWRRDWRVRGELVGKGSITLLDDGVYVRGRRTTPVRSALRASARLGFWVTLLACMVFVALTSSGLSFRTGNVEWLLAGPLLGWPAVWLVLWAPAALFRRTVQPRVGHKLPWSAVQRVASDGLFLQVQLKLPKGSVSGRLRPKWWGRSKLRATLRTIRDGGLPDVGHKVTSRSPHSPWWDRAFVVVAAAGLLLGGLQLQERLLGGGLIPAVQAADVAPAVPSLTVQAQNIASATPMVPPGAGAREAIDGVTDRAAVVWKALGPKARGDQAVAQVERGFLSAVPWTTLLNTVSIQASLPRFEVARQRLDGGSPSERMGRRFLFSLAQEFLEQVPPPRGSWSARVDVAETWLDVQAGTRWTLDGRAVQVPDSATAQVYQAIGYFMLADLALNMEQQIDQGDNGLFETMWVSFRLARHGVHLDPRRSSSTKAIIKWGTGDFEYVLSRVWLKAAQKLRDEQSAIEEAKRAGYSLGSGWSGHGGGVRTAALMRNGRGLGWVALADPKKVAVDWRVVGGSGVSTSGAVLQTSGAYVTKDNKTAGLSVQGGVMVNYMLDRKLGGLVVVGGDGRVRIFELDNGVRLPGMAEVLYPAESLGDLYLLLEELRRGGASAFQTHVLAANGALTIRADQSSGELRERRMLVTATYRGNEILALVDIPGSSKMSLYESAVVAFAGLEAAEGEGPGLDVVGIANLDVGSFDVLDVRDDRGTLLREGPVPLGSAMNLMRWAVR